MAKLIASLLLLQLAAVLPASATQLRLHHRIFHPSLPYQAFVQRGTFSVSNDQLSVVPAPSLYDDLIRLSQLLDTHAIDTSDALYQLALEHPDDKSDAQWDISSVKACHLGQATSQILLLHASNYGQPPFTADYFVEPTPHDGSCEIPKKSKKPTRVAEYAMRTFADNIQHLNMSVVVRHSAFPPSPELRIPPPLTRDGEVVQPVPEKSFIQKYWMYMVAILIALLMSGGAEEERPRRVAQ